MAIPKARTGKKTINVYVGHERFEKLLQLAIDVSQESRVQITPSQFVQWMVDRFAKQASQEMLQELSKKES
ncbi:hypothetical protein CAZ14_31960 [Pseudomonas aeruginosa]|uniref:Uncharacterized protein n=1 Tax=Pseudomonas aeruginosa TaxID=287 RepID=A0A5P9W9P9_PSEAI|nr:hypothetical protein [Pseudomonas aeruginosa]KSQ71665.1 hypothetical protein APB36_20995 [Pseudomonas aeruginosa]MDV2246137.1 hypothetical protein [Pseudomonas aeruginosa]OTH42175.1 hypothetical protein CAY88_35000 [Pseudomonas aeruginosa]OTH88432.1 hypothetical protein CAZ14_31960 [Pseudomonas aeruginosa]QFX78192.1 hypothetical protein PNK5461_c0048 [Pseudomonas aeruginosa]